MNIFGCTDKGVVRSSNQDAYFTGTFNDGTVFAVVCDGMGGANGGNIASRLAVDYLSASLKAGYREKMSENSIRNLLDSSIYAANIRVFDKSRESKDLNGMGTTVVVAIVKDNIGYIAHVGDSRAYVVSNNGLVQLTRDHSIVQSMIEDGKITPDEARVHPRKNVITRALGVEETVVPEFTVCDFNNNDILLLCTDGLTNYVDAKTIENVILSNEYSDPTIKLIEIANSNGGGDNITAVVIKNI